MISIIVPIYQTEKYIKECVDSILGQTYAEIEVILVDDGSTDNCPTICDEYAKKDSRIKVIHKKNGGLVSARQAGLEAAKGDYIGFVDGDDSIEADMFETMAKAAEKYSPDVICSEFYQSFAAGTEISDQCFEEGIYNKERLIKEIYPRMLYGGRYYRFGISPNCWSKLFKRELLKKYLPLVDPKTRMGEDAAFTYPCLLDAESVYCIKKPFYKYRILNSSMSRGYDEGLEKIIFLPYETICEANKRSVFDISKQLAYYHIYLANFVVRNAAKGRKKDSDFAKRLIGNAELKKSADTVNTEELPIHTRFLVNAIRKSKVTALKLYIKGMSLYLR